MSAVPSRACQITSRIFKLAHPWASITWNIVSVITLLFRQSLRCRPANRSEDTLIQIITAVLWTFTDCIVWTHVASCHYFTVSRASEQTFGRIVLRIGDNHERGSSSIEGNGAELAVTKVAGLSGWVKGLISTSWQASRLEWFSGTCGATPPFHNCTSSRITSQHDTVLCSSRSEITFFLEHGHSIFNLLVDLSVSALSCTNTRCSDTFPFDIFHTICAAVVWHVVVVVAFFTCVDNTITTGDIGTHRLLAIDSCAKPIWLNRAILITAVTIYVVAVITRLSAETWIEQAITAAWPCNHETLFHHFVSEVKNNNFHFTVIQRVNVIGKWSRL